MKKLSGLQIAAFILFAVQLIVLIIGGIENAGTIAYSIGYMFLAIIGFVLLFLDYRKKHAAPVNDLPAPTPDIPTVKKAKKPLSAIDRDILLIGSIVSLLGLIVLVSWVFTI
ncbi:MAG: hypothetical protein EOM87_08130 [Clostridia bacterium]|nr:hypothetical protein [Clostridia bacterium]